jgi:hypothetical protein
MEIPEITESQLKTLLTVCLDPNTSVFSQSAPMVSDTLASQIALSQLEKDAEHLVALKLLKEITADHLERIEKTNAETGRTWRVFEIRPLARAMFQAYCSPLVN